MYYMEDHEGVHVMHPVEDGTVCGTYDSEHNDLQHTRKTVVTCPNCIRILQELRTVKFKEPNHAVTRPKPGAEG